ncbi:MAG TPA: C39 family peptidase [Burkholderiaceae bacterium]
MLLILLGVVAAAIMGATVVSQHEPLNRPQMDVELNVAKVGGGTAPESVQVYPYQYYKYKHIVHQAFDYSCGSAALTTVLQYHLGLPVTEKDAMEGMLEHGERDKIIARRGFSLLDMKRYVATLGSDSGGFKADIDDLAKLDQPAIVPIDYAGFKHFVVVKGIRDNHVYIADPSAGNIAFSVPEFVKLWDKGTLFVIYPSKTKPIVQSSLSLSDQDLGIIAPDLVREDIALRPADNRDALQRAVQSGLGQLQFKRQ